MNAWRMAALAGSALLLAEGASAQCLWASEGLLTPAGGYGSEPHYFARSMSLEFPELLLGSPGLDGAIGSAELFQKTANGWIPTATLLAAGAQPYDDFGRAVALAGDVAAVGAPLAAGGLGRVHVFERTPGGWIEVAALPPPLGSGGHLGQSLALSGSVLLAGAPAAGAVAVYERGPSGWTLTDVIAPADDDGAESFGASLAFDGARAVIGAPDDEGAFVFEPGLGGWQQTATLEADDEYIETEFGTSVALSGDVLAVGAEGEEEEESLGGAVYVFRFDGTWGLEATVPAPSGQAGTRFGASVALDGAVLAVGSPGDQGGLGHVYTFFGVQGHWFEAATLSPYLTGSEGQFGAAVVLADDALLANIGLDETGLLGAVGPYAGAAHSWVAIDLGCQPLLRDVAQISVSAGGAQAFLLGAGFGDDAGTAYLVLGSASGTEPGLLLGSVDVPLVPDPYFVWTANNPNEGPLVGTFGLWTPGTPSIAELKLPPSSQTALVGLTLHHAFVALDLASPVLFVQASNAVSLDLVP